MLFLHFFFFEHISNSWFVLIDFQSQYKGLLQNYAQQKNLDPPLYMSESDGPSHTIRFKATVTVGGQTFESPMFFKTLKGAEQAAAKAALMSLSPDGFQKASFLNWYLP